MSDPLGFVVPGDDLQIPAWAWNRLMEMARDHFRGGRLTGQAVSGLDEDSVGIHVRNNSGADVGQFAILKVTDPLVAARDSFPMYASRHALNGIAPDATSVFCVTQAPIANGSIGPAVIMGETAAKLNVTDATHKYAVPSTNTSTFDSAASGPAEIISYDTSAGTTGTNLDARLLIQFPTPASDSCCCDGTLGGTTPGVTPPPAPPGMTWVPYQRNDDPTHFVYVLFDANMKLQFLPSPYSDFQLMNVLDVRGTTLFPEFFAGLTAFQQFLGVQGDPGFGGGFKPFAHRVAEVAVSNCPKPLGATPTTSPPSVGLAPGPSLTPSAAPSGFAGGGLTPSAPFSGLTLGGLAPSAPGSWVTLGGLMPTGSPIDPNQYVLPLTGYRPAGTAFALGPSFSAPLGGAALGGAVANMKFVNEGGTGVTGMAAGSILYAATANPDVLTELPVGADGLALIISGGVPTYASPGTNTKFTDFADASSVNAAETDLYTHTLTAGQLANNGEAIEGYIFGVYAGNGNAKTLRVYFGGTAAPNGATAGTGSWSIRYSMIRVDSANVRMEVTYILGGVPLATYTAITGLTLGNTQVVKVTGQGTTTNDIVAKGAKWKWSP